MTRVVYSEDLYFLLLKVTRAVVLFHDSCEAHIPGFSWVGSDMAEWAQESLKDFRHAGLIEVGRHEPSSRPPCGTPRGYRWHMKWDGCPCPPCASAKAQEENAYRVRRGQVRSVRVPTALLGLLVNLADQATRARVEDSLGEPVVEACLAVAGGAG